VFFLNEHISGKLLWDVLNSLNILDEFSAKFYTCCIILILEYLHERNIFARAITPLGIRIDEEGYPKLCDLFVCKIIENRTTSVTGIP
jgi:serine/threonine protein kinase